MTQDALGHVRRITDSGGSIVFSANYDAWGNLLSVTDSVPGGWMYRYMGQWGCRLDPDTGLVYCRQRWLDTNLQRFVSRDSFRSLNRYDYSYNNPSTFTDHNGLYPDGSTAWDTYQKNQWDPENGPAIRDAQMKVGAAAAAAYAVVPEATGWGAAAYGYYSGNAAAYFWGTGVVVGAEGAGLALGQEMAGGAPGMSPVSRSAGGRRQSPFNFISRTQERKIAQQFKSLGGDACKLRFNQGPATAYIDATDEFYIRGDIYPSASGEAREIMSPRAVLGHELGHQNANIRAIASGRPNTVLPGGAWNDEFRASYWAARNLPNLTDQDRIYLLQDAVDRASQAGVPTKPNAFMRRYGF